MVDSQRSADILHQFHLKSSINFHILKQYSLVVRRLSLKKGRKLFFSNSKTVKNHSIEYRDIARFGIPIYLL